MNRLAIRLFLPDADNPYQQLQANVAMETAARLGASVEVDYAQGDFSLQVRQIFKATRHDGPLPDVVMVMPVQESALKSLSETTVGLNIGWVYLNRCAGNVPALRRVNPKVPSCLVTPDQKEIGRVHARQLRQVFPEGAHILYLQGRVTTSSSEARAAGLREGLAEPGPRIEIVSTIDGNWTATDARSSLTRWLHLMLPARLRIDAVVCQSDFMALGALEALRTMGETRGDGTLAGMPVIGCDGLATVGKRLVDEGRLTATVLVPTSADRAVESLVSFFRYGSTLPEEIRLTPHAYPDEGVLRGRVRELAAARS
jgi:ABC-type sugar transport system substrate-binding protein